MHIYFSGIGGVALGPLALIAKNSGYQVSGSDIVSSRYTAIIKNHDIPVYLDQTGEAINKLHKSQKIDWFIMTSALPKDHPELIFAKKNDIKISKRDDLINYIIKQKNLKMIAVAGTHGKTTTTGMLIWLFEQLKIPISYSVGTNISYGESGQYMPNSQYFIYEADEFDKNFLSYRPNLSIVTNIEFDHPDTYKDENEYLDSFKQFCLQSNKIICLPEIAKKLNNKHIELPQKIDFKSIILPGTHNKIDAVLAISAVNKLTGIDIQKLIEIINRFPGTERRFEQLATNLYTDYAHHPTEIRVTIEGAKELNKNVIIIYQPHQNIRQHQIKKEYKNSFDKAQKVYWLPTYLSREPKENILAPAELIKYLDQPEIAEIATLDDQLWQKIKNHIKNDNLVIAMGAGNIDNWLRNKIAKDKLL